MIDDVVLKEIILKEETQDIEILEVIRRYIWDKKQIDVGKIQRPNNMISDVLFRKARQVVFDYYLPKFSE